jgi:hypothetical protein
MYGNGFRKVYAALSPEDHEIAPFVARVLGHTSMASMISEEIANVIEANRAKAQKLRAAENRLRA